MQRHGGRLAGIVGPNHGTNAEEHNLRVYIRCVYIGAHMREHMRCPSCMLRYASPSSQLSALVSLLRLRTGALKPDKPHEHTILYVHISCMVLKARSDWSHSNLVLVAVV